MAIKHLAVKAPGNTLAAITDWNANHTIDPGTILRSATLIVAASDSNDTTNADYFCDGTADQVQINAAIDSLPATGGVVKLMDGTFNITAQITIDVNNTSIIGCGKNTIIRTNANHTMIFGNGLSGLVIKDIFFYGATYSMHATHAIHIINLSYSIIRDNWFTELGGYALLTTKNSHHNLIVGNILYGAVNHSVRSTCFRFTGGNSSTPNENIITNNFFENIEDYAIEFLGGYRNLIANNTIKNSQNFSSINIRVWVSFTPQDNVIVGNVIEDADTYAIEVNGADGTIIENNMCRGTGYESVIKISNSDGCIIKGNTVLNGRQHGIHLNACDDCIVEGNICKGNDKNNTTTYDGINIDGDSNNNVIIGNRCQDNDRYEIRIDDATGDKNLVACNSCIGTDHVGTISDAGTDTMLIGNDEGDGFKFGNTTNYTEIKRDGEINLHGTARVINHVIMPAESFKLAGVADPAFGLEGTFITLDFVHTLEKEAFAKGFIPFRWDSDTDVEVRIDWLTDADGTGGDVVWGIEYLARKDNEVVAGATTTITQAFTGVGAGLMQRNVFTTKLLKGNLEADDIIGIRIFRDHDAAGDTLDLTARILALHLHFIRNKIGKAT
ncbi:hypothetical protein ES703_95367 [subsurface metagenome]